MGDGLQADGEHGSGGTLPPRPPPQYLWNASPGPGGGLGSENTDWTSGYISTGGDRCLLSCLCKEVKLLSRCEQWDVDLSGAWGRGFVANPRETSGHGVTGLWPPGAWKV